MPKGQFADEYDAAATLAARQACLLVAVRLGSLLDELVVVGGLVPSLLIQPAGTVEPHVGTADLDVGISLALLDSGQYAEIAEQLHAAGFAPDVNAQNNPTYQRWRSGFGVTMDFLIPPTRDVQQGGRLQNLTADFAAIVTPGLELAFTDRELVTLDERLVGGERAIRQVGVCGPGAFVVLKAQAFNGRGEPKDAYDLHYMIANLVDGPSAIAARINHLRPNPDVETALTVLERDFAEADSIGPASVARFLQHGLDDEIQADVAGLVRELLRLL